MNVAPLADASRYVGTELELFQRARNWKSYWAGRLGRYVRGRVLEVGAGIGGTTRVLNRGPIDEWVCLEPDPRLAERLRSAADDESFAVRPSVVTGTLAALPAAERFDTILYIDVLEHIERDAEEVAAAVARLRPGGHLVTLSPAHNGLFSPFDRAIGHFRRYDRAMLRRLTPPGSRLAEAYYLDSCGLMVSLANRLLLRSGTPKLSQILLWDRLFVRLSRMADPLTGYRLGKSVVAVWSAPGGGMF